MSLSFATKFESERTLCSAFELHDLHDFEALVQYTYPYEFNLTEIVRSLLKQGVQTFKVLVDSKNCTSVSFHELVALVLKEKGDNGIEVRIKDEGVTGTAVFLHHTDSGKTILFSCKPVGAQNELLNAKFYAYWSWGDPDKVAVKTLAEYFFLWDAAKAFEPEPADPLDLLLGFPLHKHQKSAITAWTDNHYHGLFKMCTGAGKTIASLAATRLLEQNQNLKTVVILCPTQVLVEQWAEEISKLRFGVPLLAYDNVRDYVNRLPYFLKDSRHEGLKVVITTYKTFPSIPFGAQIQSAIQDGTKALLIADEVHNVSTSIQQSSLDAAKDYFAYRIGLSATPEIEHNPSATNFILEYFGGVVGSYELRDAIWKDHVLCHYNYYPVPVFLSPESSARYMSVLSRLSEGEFAVDDRRMELYQERRDILRKSEVSLDALGDVLRKFRLEDLYYTLIYCPPGSDLEGANLLELANKKIHDIHDTALVTSITTGVSKKDRTVYLNQFEKKGFHVLLGIGCLDEGLDIPAMKRAIMLYSYDRERQFVQRRGRVLRKHPGKERADIYDIIVLPHGSGLAPSVAEALLARELRRYSKFAELASNEKDASRVLQEAMTIAIGGSCGTI